MFAHGRHPRIGMPNRHNRQNSVPVVHLRKLDLVMKPRIGGIVFSVGCLNQSKLCRSIQGPHTVAVGQGRYEIGPRAKHSRRCHSQIPLVGSFAKGLAVLQSQDHGLVVTRIGIEIFDNLRPGREFRQFNVPANSHVFEFVCCLEPFFGVLQLFVVIINVVRQVELLCCLFLRGAFQLVLLNEFLSLSSFLSLFLSSLFAVFLWI
mmetsp:Transcript_232/g.526  ORF Transcript_232/g.526 Transcript_232/m.526 type:complete len:205 (+) Transcript_232:823-1437(+)